MYFEIFDLIDILFMKTSLNDELSIQWATHVSHGDWQRKHSLYVLKYDAVMRLLSPVEVEWISDLSFCVWVRDILFSSQRLKVFRLTARSK